MEEQCDDDDDDDDDFVLTRSAAARLVWKNQNEQDLSKGEAALRKALEAYFRAKKEDAHQ